jgi:tetratricopeptide (TPR) repeat protein
VALLQRLNTNPNLAPLVAQFVPLKISTEGQEWQTWARRYQAPGNAIPIIYIVRADGEQLHGSSGSQDAPALAQLMLQTLSQAGRVYNNQELTLLTENVTAAQQALAENDVYTAVVKLKALKKLGDLGEFKSYAKPALSVDEIARQLSDDGKKQLEDAVAQLKESPDDFVAALAYTEAKRIYSQLPTLTPAFVAAARLLERTPESEVVLKQADAISKARGYAKTSKSGVARAVDTLNRLIAQHPDTPAADTAKEDLQQLGGEVKAPPPSGLAPLRTWTDTTGQFRIQARLVKIEPTQVTLQRAAGETLVVPLSRLSDGDRRFVESQQQRETSKN